MKQKELASKLNLSPSHLSEIESGTKSVSYELLEKYSSAFNLPISTITFLEEAASQSSPTSLKFKISANALKLLEWLEIKTHGAESQNAESKHSEIRM